MGQKTIINCQPELFRINTETAVFFNLSHQIEK